MGKGSVMVTPLQVAYVIGGIVAGGEFKRAHLLKDAQNVGEKQVELAESTVEQVTQGMYGVINEAGGTGNSVKLQGIEFCGKSGTAQMMSYSAASRLGLGKGKNDGWFVGFAPRRDPEIVVAAVVEDTSEHGGTAAGARGGGNLESVLRQEGKEVQGPVHGAESAARRGTIVGECSCCGRSSQGCAETRGTHEGRASSGEKTGTGVARDFCSGSSFVQGHDERNNDNTRLRLVAAGDHRCHLRTRRSGNLFRHARHRLSRHPFQTNPLT